MVVNTASECGFTPQFEGLEALHEERRRDGFVILGFPADDVAGQEPRSDVQIAEFAERNFGVSFPIFARSNVVEEPVNPLFARLAAEAGPPTWNFNKYLLDRDGAAVARYDAGTAPDDPVHNNGRCPTRWLILFSLPDHFKDCLRKVCRKRRTTELIRNHPQSIFLTSQL